MYILHLFFRKELNSFNTVMLIFGLYCIILKMNIVDVFSTVLQRPLNSTFMSTIQGGCFIIRTMNKTNGALNTSDIKLIDTKYYSIRTVVIIREEFLKASP